MEVCLGAMRTEVGGAGSDHNRTADKTVNQRKSLIITEAEKYLQNIKASPVDSKPKLFVPNILGSHPYLYPYMFICLFIDIIFNSPSLFLSLFCLLFCVCSF